MSLAEEVERDILAVMSEQTNFLRHAASSYLRSAMHQPVQWYQWGSEAFQRAATEQKPILLDIGAVWCHWCHVMDRESYEDPDLASLINERFIAIKVDRDERPDIDSRYQTAVSAISGQGGWPLTAVLTSDGRPFFGGTYFPKEDRYNRPGLARVLLTMSDVWNQRRGEVLESAGSVMEAIEQSESFAGRRGPLSLQLVQKLVASATSLFDSRHGGFGSQPKFPYPSTLDLLIDVSSRTGNEDGKKTATVTLNAMARGGVYDQLGGGFHRYSVDERWVVPHFEKMLYDNAGLLRNYVHAYQTFVQEHYADLARDIIRWMDEWLSDREQGGFYASQDADINLDDDGDYFTWTLAEAKAVLNEEELRLATDYWDIGELGDMHHDPSRNVLHVAGTLERLAGKHGVTQERAIEILSVVKQKLYLARLQRPTPFVDKTIYTGWNAMAISAYLEAAQVLQLDDSKDFALRTLNRLLQEAWDSQTGMVHVIAYNGNHSQEKRVAGVLDDYAFTVHACLDAWAATGDLKYYRFAVEIADAMIARFYDEVGSSFFDMERSPDTPAIGALAASRKPLQDAPTPAGNPVAASALLRLESLSGNKKYHEIAEDTLESFAGIVEGFGMYASTYGLALEQLLRGSVQVVIVGQDREADRMSSLATARYAINKTVLRFLREDLNAASLPPALAETLPFLPQEETGGSFAVLCRGNSCLPPVKTAEALVEVLSTAV
jgi:uncharacterized protein